MSTYATTATITTVYGDEVDVSRNLLGDDADGASVRLDLPAVDSVYLGRDHAIALAFALLEAAGEQPVGRFCHHDERGSHPGDSSSKWTRNGLTFPNLGPVCPAARPVYVAPPA